MIIWLIGMSSAGKTVISRELYSLIKEKYKNTVFVDGDILRDMSNNDVDHSIAGRKKNSDRICRLCQFLDNQDINVVCAVLSIFHEAQQWNRENYKKYFEIYLDVPFEILKQRNNKGLYTKALAGEINNVVGVDIEFKPPKNPEMVIKNDGSKSPARIAQMILEEINQINKWD